MSRRHWYAFDPPSVAVAVLYLSVLVGLWAFMEYRRQIADLPESGRATPQHVLDSAFAESEGPESCAGPPAQTQPHSNPNRRPFDDRMPQ